MDECKPLAGGALDGGSGEAGGTGGGGGGAGPGVCVFANPRFVTALSPRLFFDRTAGRWRVAEPSAADAALPGGADPLWAESNWPPGIGIIMYHHEAGPAICCPPCIRRISHPCFLNRPISVYYFPR